MLSKQQKTIAAQLMRASAIERLSRMGAPVKPEGKAKISYLAKLVNQYAGLPFTEDPMDMIRAFATEKELAAVPSRELNGMRQPAYKMPPAFVIAAERARACQPPMMSVCGLREGWDGL